MDECMHQVVHYGENANIHAFSQYHKFSLLPRLIMPLMSFNLLLVQFDIQCDMVSHSI